MIPIKDKNNELNITVERMTFHEMMDLEDRILNAKLALRRAQNDTRWRKAVEYLLDDDDVILSSMAPLGTAKTTWRQVKALAEQWSEEE